MSSPSRMNVASSGECNLFVGCYPQQLSVKSDVQAHMSTQILCAKIAGGQSMLVLIHPNLAPPSPSLFSHHPQPSFPTKDIQQVIPKLLYTKSVTSTSTLLLLQWLSGWVSGHIICHRKLLSLGPARGCFVATQQQYIFIACSICLNKTKPTDDHSMLVVIPHSSPFLLPFLLPLPPSFPHVQSGYHYLSPLPSKAPSD